MNGGGPPNQRGQTWAVAPPVYGPPPVPGQAYTGPSAAAGPYSPTGERMAGLWSEADLIAAQRQAMAQQYLARVQAGQRAALAQQQLGLGGLQQQQMAAGVRGPLGQRAAMYGQSRAAGDMIAQQALAAAQEEQAAQALLQQTYGAGAQQKIGQAQQQLQSYGMGQEMAVARQQQAAAAQQAEDEYIKGIIGASFGGAASAMAASDRRLKQDVRRPRTAAERELLEALMGGDHG